MFSASPVCSGTRLTLLTFVLPFVGMDSWLLNRAAMTETQSMATAAVPSVRYNLPIFVRGIHRLAIPVANTVWSAPAIHRVPRAVLLLIGILQLSPVRPTVRLWRTVRRATSALRREIKRFSV